MGGVVKRVVVWAGAAVAAVVVLTGCSIGSTPTTTSTAVSVSGSTRATEPLAFGAFAPTSGISGDLFVEGVGEDVGVRLSSFDGGGSQLRLLLTDSEDVKVGGCLPPEASTASVGGSPAGPTSTFALAKRADVQSGAVPRFSRGTLVRQRTDADVVDCAEPVAAVALIEWSN